MSITARDLFFVLRVRDEASGALNGVTRDLLKVGNAAQAQSLRAQAAGLRQEAANKRAANTVLKETDEVKANARALEARASQLNANADAQAKDLRARAAGLRALAEERKLNGGSDVEVENIKNNARLLEQEARLLKANTAAETSALRLEAAEMKQGAAARIAADETEKESLALEAQASALEKSARKADAAHAAQTRLNNALSSVGKAATLAGIALIGVGAVGAVALLSTTKSAVEYQRQVALTQTQVDGFKASLQDLGQEGIDVANQIAAPFDQMQATLYDIFSSTDANLAESKVLLTAFAKGAVAGQVDVQDASTATMGIMNAFKIPLSEVNRIMDIQFQLVRKGVGTYAQFSSVIGRAVPSARRYGASIQDLAGALAYLTRNGLSPAMAAASAARAFDALGNSKTVMNMKDIGIEAYTAAGKLKPFTELLGEIQKKILAMPKKSQLPALQALFLGGGGTIQARRFLDQVILHPEQLKALNKFINDMNHSSGQFQSAYSKMSKTVSAQTQLLQNKWQTLKVFLGNTLLPVLIVIVDWLNKILTKFEKLSPTTQKVIIWLFLAATALAILGGALLIVGGAIITLLGAMATLGISLSGAALIISGVGIALLAIAGFVYILWKHTTVLQTAWKDLIKIAKDLWGYLVDFAKGVRRAWDHYLWPVLAKIRDIFKRDIGPALARFSNWTLKTFNTKVREAMHALMEWAENGIKVAAWAIKSILMPMIKEIIDYLGKHKKEVKEFTSFMASNFKYLIIVVGAFVVVIGVLLVGALIVLAGVIFAVVHSIIGMVEAIDKIIAGIKKVIGWIGDLISWLWKFATYGSNVFANMVLVIKAAFANARSFLVNAGKDIIQGLIDGITSSMGKLGSTLKDVGVFIITHKGPKSKDLKMLRPAGNYIMTGLINGIHDQMNNLSSTVTEVNKTIMPHTNSQYGMQGSSATSTAPGQPQKVINNHITVNTQEVNPRKHAADLGWELSMRQ